MSESTPPPPPPQKKKKKKKNQDWRSTFSGLATQHRCILPPLTKHPGAAPDSYYPALVLFLVLLIYPPFFFSPNNCLLALKFSQSTIIDFSTANEFKFDPLMVPPPFPSFYHYLVSVAAVTMVTVSPASSIRLGLFLLVASCGIWGMRMALRLATCFD